MTEFVGQSVAQYSLRPRRLGYLIRSRDRAQFLAAMRYASSEWGGIGQPIVPMTPSRGVSRGYLELCDMLAIEVFIDYAGISEEVRHLLRSRYGAEIYDPSSGSLTEPGAHVLAALPSGTFEGRQMDLPTDASSLLQTAVLGSIWDNDEPLWRETGLRPDRVSTPLELYYAQLQRRSEIEFTRAQLATFELAGGMPGMILFCLDRPSWGELLWFWNLRALSTPALGRDVMLASPCVLTENPKAAASLRDACLAKGETKPDLVLMGRDPDEMDRVGRAAGFTRMPTDGQLTWRFAGRRERNLTETPLTFGVNLQPGLFLGRRRSQGVQGQILVPVASPETTVYITSPARFRRTFGGRIRLEIRGIDALEWPHRPSVARLIHNHGSYTEYGIGLVTTPNDRYQFVFRTPEPANVAEAILGEQGWTWSLSDKGRYAQALRGSLSGIEALAAVGSTQALSVVRALTSLSRPKAEQAIRQSVGTRRIDAEQLRQTLDDVLPSLVPRWRSLGEVSGVVGAKREHILPVLEGLLEERLVLRGFRFKCEVCNLRAYLPLGREADRITCEGCGSSSLLRGPEGQEPMLFYSLNTLLDRVMDQDCLGHLLAARWVTNLGRMLWFAPGTNVTNEANGEAKEIDLLGLSHSELLVGEVKATAGAFRPAVVRRTVDLARNLGATTVVLAALDAWPEDLGEMAVRFAESKGLQVLLGGATELLG